MSKIRILPDKLINQIAAGEVVERPFSVVKELIDNSIDSGASKITVRLQDSGKSAIEIIDDGCGMNADDLAHCIKRHATSKLATDNLNNINTLGFRGEALPSIASVSKLCIKTRTSDCEIGHEININFGEESGIVACNHHVGTSVIVSDIFSQIPVRLKFLRSDTSERAAISKVINTFALRYHNIHFIMESDGKEVFNYLPTDIDGRLAQVLGEDFVENTIEVSNNFEYGKVSGRISIPTYGIKSNSSQFFFINGRIVKDKMLSQMLKSAYNDVMMHSLFPCAYLDITLDPFEVDINAHPAKTEVRFRDPNMVRSFLYHTIKNALQNAPLRTTNNLAQVYSSPRSSNNNFGTSTKSGFNSSSSLPKNYSFSTSASAQPSFSEPFTQAIKPLSSHVSVYQAQQSEAGYLGEALFQIDNTYIVARSNDKLIIIDQHAAHERLTLEKIKHHKIISQPLLIPITVNLPEIALDFLEKHANVLSAFGLNVSFLKTHLEINEIPNFLQKECVESLVQEIVEELLNDESSDAIINKRDDVIANVACKASIKAGRTLSITEMNALLRDMEKTPLSSQCNHGRPTFLEFNTQQLARMFVRS